MTVHSKQETLPAPKGSPEDTAEVDVSRKARKMMHLNVPNDLTKDGQLPKGSLQTESLSACSFNPARPHGVSSDINNSKHIYSYMQGG